MIANKRSFYSHSQYRVIYGLKGELGELEFYFKKIPLYQQKFWWFRFFLIRLSCREI